MVFLISVLLAAIAFMIVFLVISYLFHESIYIADRLGHLKSVRVTNHTDELNETFTRRVIKPILNELGDIISGITPQGMSKKIDKELQKAGRPFNLSINQWFSIRLAFMVGIPVIMVIVFIAIGQSDITSIFMFFFCILVSILIPDLFLRAKVRKRQTEIIRSLPDVLDLLTVSVEAGTSFNGAMAKLVEKSEGTLSDEFKRALSEMKMGKSRKEALKAMSQRCDVPDLTMLLSSIIQADELGVGMSKVLRVQSAQMREKRKQRAQEKAMKAPVKMLFPLIIFIFPAIFIVLLGPAVLKILDVFMSM